MKYDHHNKIEIGFGRLRWEKAVWAGDIHDTPLRVLGCGLSRWGPWESFSRVRSTIFVVELVTRGNVVLVQNRREYLIETGQAFLLHKNSFHEYHTGLAGWAHKRYLTMDGPLLDPMLRATGLKGVGHVVLSDPDEIVRILRECYRLIDRKESGFGQRCSELAYKLLLTLGQDLKVSYPEALQRALSFMENHLGETLSREDMAEAAGLSETHFNRLFKEHLQVTPVAWFIRQKMEMAKYLLRETKLPVKEVAEATGYMDALYFSAQFKKYVGMSPKFYKRGESFD
ncbi:MAG: AraC family transcriptional regulator [Sedimentisphaerales bacterium]|nr:AraC family transcriptional regulator [Sedimentisphaerales bacterium]